MINALLDGAAYPALEQLTGGKSFVEMKRLNKDVECKKGCDFEMYGNKKALQVFDLQGFDFCASRWA